MLPTQQQLSLASIAATSLAAPPWSPRENCRQNCSLPGACIKRNSWRGQRQKINEVSDVKR